MREEKGGPAARMRKEKGEAAARMGEEEGGSDICSKEMERKGSSLTKTESKSEGQFWKIAQGCNHKKEKTSHHAGLGRKEMVQIPLLCEVIRTGMAHLWP